MTEGGNNVAAVNNTEMYKRKDIEHMVRSLILPSEFAKSGEQIFVKGSGIKPSKTPT